MSNAKSKDLVQSALQLNKNHQYALKIYTERLEAELENLDKLVVSLKLKLLIYFDLRPDRLGSNQQSLLQIQKYQKLAQ